MPKQFTAKPIRLKTALNAKTGAEKQGAEKQPDEMFALPPAEIQKPIILFRFPWLAVVLAIIFGFGGGMSSHYFFKTTPLGSGEQKVIIDKNEEVTVTSEERLTQIADKINPVVINFYKAASDLGGPFYQDEHSYGTGFIITSDGWALTAQSVMEKIGANDYVVLTKDYQILKVEKIIRDPISPAVFLKLKASNLPVAKLGKISQMSSGQKVYGFIAAYPTPRVASLHLADLQISTLDDVVASSEKISHYVSAREGYHSSLFGAPLVNLTGEIIALVDDSATALPLEYLATAISDLGKKEKIERVKFGVHYIDLAKYPKVDPTAAGEMLDKGAYLSGFRNLTAVEKGSPADKAGLQIGDIITLLEDETVNGKKTLTQMVQEYNPGDEVKMTIIRDGKERVVNVKFGTLK